MSITFINLARDWREDDLTGHEKLGRVEILSEVMDQARQKSTCCVGVEAALDRRVASFDGIQP